MDFLISVTTAGFVEAAFWPGLILMVALLIVLIKRPVELGWFAVVIAGYFAFYAIWMLVYGVQTVAGVTNRYIFILLTGAMMFLAGAVARRPFFVLKAGTQSLGMSTSRRILVLFVGFGLLVFGSWTLFQDYFRPRQVLEGRAENVRTMSRKSGKDYVVDIDRRTVKTTWPVHERLKLRPYVRVEVGRGSNYIYKIAYLAN